MVFNRLEENINEKRKKIRDLKKERYNLRYTLKKLEAKLESGIISEIEYFMTYKNLQKEIYLINNRIIRSLNERLKKKES